MISAVDHGPGIENLEQVLQPGYSTAPEWIREHGILAQEWLGKYQEMFRREIHFLSEPGGRYET